MIYRAIRLLSGTLLVLLPFGLVAERALALGWQSETLSGLSQLQVQVGKDCPAGAGASEADLKVGVETYLSRRGVAIDPTPAGQQLRPNAYLSITCTSSIEGDFAYAMSMRVYQPIEFNGQVFEAATYSAGESVGYTNVFRYTNEEGDLVIQLLDVLITDWNETR
jgi:hypothetical protein